MFFSFTSGPCLSVSRNFPSQKKPLETFKPKKLECVRDYFFLRLIVVCLTHKNMYKQEKIKQLTKNSPRIKYFALTTCGSSDDSYTASCGSWYAANSGKYVSNLCRPALIFSANMSCLFKNKIIEIVLSHLLFQIFLNSANDSLSRFWVVSSHNTKLYELLAQTNWK